jgi:D-3-phosphoglycerate dehydrogenase
VSEAPETLILDLLEWLERRERSYVETMDAWRTSCPRLPVWEDASEQGFVRVETRSGRQAVCVTPEGHELLSRLRPNHA